MWIANVVAGVRASDGSATVVRLKMMKVSVEQAKDLASKIDTFIHSTGD